MTSAADSIKGSNGQYPATENSDWTEKFSKKYSRSFWKNIVTGEKLWHPPNSNTISTHLSEPNRGTVNSSSSNSSRDNRSPITVLIRAETPIAFQKAVDMNHFKNNEVKVIPATVEKNESNSNLSVEKKWLGNGREKNQVTLPGDDTYDYPGWEQHRSKKYNRMFWRNKVTLESTWIRYVECSLKMYSSYIYLSP